MLLGRLQVLADRDDVDVVGAEVAKRLDHFVIRLAHANDDAALCQQRTALGKVFDPQFLGALKDV